MSQVTALILAFVSGLFFVVGFILVKYVSRKKELSIVATGLSFTVMLGMLFLDLIPEMISLSNQVPSDKWQKILTIILCVGLGIGFLKFLDLFLPAHHHEHHEHEKNIEEHKSHAFHIGLILAFSLIFHNILEGMSLYVIGLDSFMGGVMMTLGIGLHNLPLGLEIASSFEQTKKQNRLKMITLGLLTFSSFAGALLLFVMSGVSENALLIFISIACGMILYITLFELLKEVMEYRHEKLTFVGVGIGLILLLVMFLLG